MPTYVYRGLNADGAEVDGRLTAADEVEALRLEKEQALRAEHEAAAAVLNKTVHQWEGALVESALRPV